MNMTKIATKNVLAQLGLLNHLRYLRDVLIRIRTVILRRLYPNGKFIKCNDSPIFVDFHDTNYLWYYGNQDFLRREIEDFKTLFSQRKPNTIVDIGAHWGIFPTLLDRENYIHNLGIEHVICVEPDPRNMMKLKNTISKVKTFKVDVVPYAISDKEEFITLYNGSGSCAHTYRDSDLSKPFSEAKALPLHIILNNLKVNSEHVTHIKLDIDGYEPAFFYGAENFLRQHKPFLLIEFWSKGILSANFDIRHYWWFLNSLYEIKEPVYMESDYRTLLFDDLDYIVSKTSKGITNLLLIPK